MSKTQPDPPRLSMQQCTSTVVDTMKIVSTTTRTMQRLVQRIDPSPALSRRRACVRHSSIGTAPTART